MGNYLPNVERTCIQCAVHCAKATNETGGVEDFADDKLTCDPAGGIFEETLEDLNDMDRELLLFSAGQNLAAVRWLFVLGADKFSRDSNGTTALHTACRTGSLPIIRELLHQGIPLDVTDSSGWSPLHIAIFMCRRDAVLCLLRARAPLMASNLKNQTPLDLCNDTWTREAILSFMQHSQGPSVRPWRFEREEEAQQDVSLPNKLQYEPFFVPRSPVITEQAYKQEFFALGQLIFNKRPGQGLAFLVASGCTRDYPVDLSFFLRRGRLDLAQIGQFLGESFSLSQTLRLEFINSVKFHGTSIVSGLAKVFTLLQIPPDLQKIDRLVHGVARIWWRQHDKISEEELDGSMPAAFPDVTEPLAAKPKAAGDEAELESFELKQYLISPETLYQLMFSVVMLHWNLYAPSAGGEHEEDGRIDMAKWLEINRGIEADGSDVPVHILQRTYHTVRSGFIPQLTIRVSPTKSNLGGDPDAKGFKGSLVRTTAMVESWGWIVGESFANLAVPGASNTQILNIFSESLMGARDSQGGGHSVANSSNQRSGGIPSSSGPGRPVLPDKLSKGKDRVWLSLCCSLLFFSTSPSPEEAPYAFVHLRQVLVESSNLGRFTFSLMWNPESRLGQEGEVSNDASEGGRKALASTIKVVFLLPDGRWQECEMPRLEMQVADEQQLEKWVTHLQSVCGEVYPPAPAPEAANAISQVGGGYDPMT